MALVEGIYKGTITKNGIRETQNGSSYVELMCQIEDTALPVKVWLTPKAVKSARTQLRIAGFDVDKNDLQMLADEPELLAGKVVSVEVEDQGKYGLQGRITSNGASKEKLSSLTAMLRNADGDKKDDDGGVPF